MRRAKSPRCRGAREQGGSGTGPGERRAPRVALAEQRGPGRVDSRGGTGGGSAGWAGKVTLGTVTGQPEEELGPIPRPAQRGAGWGSGARSRALGSAGIWPDTGALPPLCCHHVKSKSSREGKGAPPGPPRSKAEGFLAPFCAWRSPQDPKLRGSCPRFTFSPSFYPSSTEGHEHQTRFYSPFLGPPPTASGRPGSGAPRHGVGALGRVPVSPVSPSAPCSRGQDAATCVSGSSRYWTSACACRWGLV